jgi:hypothetical protein
MDAESELLAEKDAEIERLKAEINRLREQLELKDQILKSVAQQGIEQQRLITELADVLRDVLPYPLHTELVRRAREATR